ncbi:MAG: HEAT repeat domain-containing protein, partial [Actinobacteria bacterium]|nr:HEAT repeat domain-containing protein [Actinomycetota bacterium]
VEPREVEDLVDCLARADDLVDMDQDLATALWECDFAHIEHRVANPFTGSGEVLPEGMIDALRETVIRRLEESHMPEVIEDDMAWGNLRAVDLLDIESERLELTAEELQRGDQSVEALTGVLRDFGEVLLEIAAGDPITQMDDIIAQPLSAVTSGFLDSGELQSAVFLIEKLGQMEAAGWCPNGFLGLVVGKAVTPDHVKRLWKGREGGGPEEAKRIDRVLLSLRNWILAPLLEILAESEDRAVRRSILGILGAEGGVPWAQLEPLLRDPRWYVVRNAVQLAASSGCIQLIEHSSRLLAHPDARVRRETLRGLERFSGQAALRGFIKALSDSDSSVRTLAAHVVGREGGPEQEALLLKRIEDRAFASLPVEEVEAVLDSYAMLAQHRAVVPLDKLWKRRRLSSRPMPIRVAAVHALGRVEGPLAQQSLAEASRSGEAQVRRAATESMQARQVRRAREPEEQDSPSSGESQ